METNFKAPVTLMERYVGSSGLLNLLAAAVEHVRVEHGGRHVLVPHRLGCPDVLAAFEQVRGEAVPQRVATLLADPRHPDRPLDAFCSALSAVWNRGTTASRRPALNLAEGNAYCQCHSRSTAGCLHASA